jgi:hypothetical protein
LLTIEGFKFLVIDIIGAAFSLLALGTADPTSPKSATLLRLFQVFNILLIFWGVFCILLRKSHKAHEYFSCLLKLRLLLEVGIIGSHLIWLYRTRHIRRSAQKASKTFDEYCKTSQPRTSWYGTGDSRRNSQITRADEKEGSIF